MTNNQKALERLKAKREALYLAEVAAWLHMLGKCSMAFIEDHKKDADLKIPTEALEPLKQVLSGDWWGKRVWRLLQNIQRLSSCNGSPTAQVSIAQLMKKHRKIGGCFPGLLQVAHGVGSGTEKPSLNLGANPSARYRSDAVGLEISPPSTYQVLHPYCSRLYENLTDLLAPLQRGGDDLSDWDTWRSDFIQQVSAPFRLALADSRIPLNDVTLFDQTFTTVAAFKAALAQVILEGKWHPPNKEPRYHWRFLHVGVDSEAWWGQAVRLNDVLSRKTTLDEALNKVKHLLEFEIPLGIEIYRDENGSMFLMPDVDALLEATDAEGNTLESQIQAIARAEFQGELLFNLTFSAPVRMLSMLTAFARMTAAPPAPLTPDVNLLAEHWAQAPRPPQGQPNTRELCSVCGLRPQGPSAKALDRQVCDVCLDRRLKQVKMWFQKPETTIWLNEIADQNGRIALIVGRFPLDEWLSGKAFDTITTVEPMKRNATYCMLQESAKCLVEQPEMHLNPHAALLPVGGVWRHLVEAHPTAEALYRFLVDAPEDSPDDPMEAWRLVLSMARQRPSPARIRRLWETTQNFWHRLDADIEEVIDPRSKRYRLIGTIRPKNPVRTHAYVLRKGRIAIPVVWDGEAFLTTLNLNMLDRRLSDEPLEAFFAPEQTFVIEEPKGYGAANKHFGEITILTAEETKTPYLPVRILMRTPRTFMALVPAERALAVVDWIAQRYHHEMAMVRNRLPIQLGVAFAPRRQPLRALLEAGSRFLAAPRLQAQEWQIIDIQEEQDGEKTVARTLILENDGRQIAWRVPLWRNDGAVEDVWYPYACLVRPAEQHPAEERQRAFAAPNPWTGDPKALWVHVSELYREDRIHFLPSTFDFVWLGSAAKRFELLYNANGLRYRLPQRPYLLGEAATLSRIWETLDKHLNKSQIYALRDAIEDRRQRWQAPWGKAERGSVFWQFCRQALANAEWQKFHWDENDLDIWADYAARGWIADAVTLYLHILKGGED